MSTDAPRIPASLADLAIPLADLAPYYRNPRSGDLDAIGESLSTHGQYKPIVVNRGTHTGRPNEILAGNHTAKAARKLGWDDIAVTWLDVDEATAAKIVIVDNRTSDLAGYDTALLADILTDLPDLEGTGYDQEQLDDLLDDTSLPAPIELPSDGAARGPPRPSTTSSGGTSSGHPPVCGSRRTRWSSSTRSTSGTWTSRTPTSGSAGTSSTRSTTPARRTPRESPRRTVRSRLPAG